MLVTIGWLSDRRLMEWKGERASVECDRKWGSDIYLSSRPFPRCPHQDDREVQISQRRDMTRGRTCK